MSEFDCINNARKQLMESLGDRDKQYLNLMKLWFKMKLSKEDFDSECKKLLTGEQVRLHNQLLLNLLTKCYGLGMGPKLLAEQPCRIPRTQYANLQGNFQPCDPADYLVTDRSQPNVDRGELMHHERLLPDHSAALARLVYTAWELGLEGSAPTTADLLVVAVQQFLKNIITAIVSRKKGCKIEQNFVHGVSEPVSNPWLKNVSTQPKKKFHSLKCDPGESSILMPRERPNKKERLEEELAFKLATGDNHDTSDQNNTVPITLYDLITTLKIYPSLVASNFVYTVNCERIWARISHPTWDD